MQWIVTELGVQRRNGVCDIGQVGVPSQGDAVDNEETMVQGHKVKVDELHHRPQLVPVDQGGPEFLFLTVHDRVKRGVITANACTWSRVSLA